MAAGPLYRGQGNNPWKTSQPQSAAKRGQTVPYDVNGAPSPAGGVTSFNTRTGAITLASADVTTALGFTPYNATNPSGYISSITSSMVTTALGYTPSSVTGLTGVQSVAAFKTGLSLVKGDVGLGSVDNTSDATKNVLSATKLTTARTLAITGDLTWTSPAFDGSANVTAAGTLATVNSNVGTFGSATQSLTATVNAKGLVTAMSAQTVTPAVGSITGLGTGVTTALAVNVGSAGAFVTFNGAGGTPSSLTLTNATGLPVAGGGTGIASYAVGDILYASASTTLSKLADVATGNVLISGGVTTAPSWGKVGLTTHVTGTLGTGNGGTGSTSASLGTGGVALSTEGTFTPTLVFGAGSTGMTFSRQDGRWKKVGNVIHVWMDLILTAKGSSTGNAQISNLPVAALAAAHVSAMLTPANMSAGTNNPRPLLVAGTTQLFIYDFNAGALNVMTDVNFTNTTELIIYLAYPLT